MKVFYSNVFTQAAALTSSSIMTLLMALVFPAIREAEVLFADEPGSKKKEAALNLITLGLQAASVTMTPQVRTAMGLVIDGAVAAYNVWGFFKTKKKPKAKEPAVETK